MQAGPSLVPALVGGERGWEEQGALEGREPHPVGHPGPRPAGGEWGHLVHTPTILDCPLPSPHFKYGAAEEPRDGSDLKEVARQARAKTSHSCSWGLPFCRSPTPSMLGTHSEAAPPTSQSASSGLCGCVLPPWGHLQIGLCLPPHGSPAPAQQMVAQKC